GYSVVYAGSDNRLDVTPTRVDVYVDGRNYPVMINDDGAVAPQGLPAEIQQDGKKVLVHYGFAGQAEIRTSQVYVQRRF
ncbi:hypothetical protein NL460_30000, partial [Klebsiella pneumoniae]|nr:hypothetical protein [Klebsiella pneumoniae]